MYAQIAHSEIRSGFASLQLLGKLEIAPHLTTIHAIFVKHIKFEGMWDELEARNCFIYKIFEKNSSFHVKSQFLFFRGFLPVLTKLSFREKD